MVTLNIKQQIILNYREGHSIRKIARDLKIHRKTVTSYVNEYSNYVREIGGIVDDLDIRKYELTDAVINPPKYCSGNRSKRKLTQEILEEIKYYLKENEDRIGRGMKKQIRKNIDIYDCLREKGYDISYSTVTNVIASIINKRNEAFIKQEYSLGEVCEFDWGECKLEIGDCLRKYNMAVFTTACGNYRYAQIFVKQDTAAFMESHSKFIKHVNGVHKIFVYDNMKVAVKGFVGPSEKEPTDALLSLSIYYGFKFRFCNVRKGNEKGHVEKSVDYIRTKAFAQRINFNSVKEANEYLIQVCNKLNNENKIYNENKSANDMLKLENAYLIPAKPALDCSVKVDLRVDKYSTITIKTCRYSVPEYYVGKMVVAKIYSEKIIVCSDDEIIAVHEVALGGHAWKLNIEHYLNTMTKKPGAIKGSLAIKQLDENLKIIYEKYFLGKEKEFIELIILYKEKNLTLKEIELAINEILNITPNDISIDKIKVILFKNPIDEKLVTVETVIHSKTAQHALLLLQSIKQMHSSLIH